MKKRTWLLLIVCLTLPALAMASGEDSAVFKYGWRVINFIGGIAALVIVGRIMWLSQDMAENGRAVKSAFGGLVLIAVLYAVAAFLLNAGSDSGTTVKGISTAIQMK